jgi:predicted enzyme related to lactoylglutathione lyase
MIEKVSDVVGQSQAITIAVSDMAAVHSQLSTKGVNFVQEPDVQPWGTYAIIEDSEKNRLILVEQPNA